MIADGLDGRIARMTNTQSAFGADMIVYPIWLLSVSRRLYCFTVGNLING